MNPAHRLASATCLAALSTLLFTSCSSDATPSASQTPSTSVSVSPTATPTESPREVRFDGYPIDTRVSAALATKATLAPNVFEAEVIGTLDPVKVQLQAGPDVIDVVYTPLEVKVTRTMRGNSAVDSTVLVRLIGGTVDGLTIEAETAPDPADFAPGDTVLVFGSTEKVSSPGDRAGVTPMFMYKASDSTFVDVSYADLRVYAGPADAMAIAKVRAALS